MSGLSTTAYSRMASKEQPKAPGRVLEVQEDTEDTGEGLLHPAVPHLLSP